MATKKSSTTLYTGMTRRSALPEVAHNTTPKIDVQNAHSRNDPSCPAQNDGNQYSGAIARAECRYT